MSDRVAGVIRPEIVAMSGYHVADAAGMVKLDAMENPYPLPPDLAAALGERLGRVAINRYPVPDYARLRSRIAARFGVPAGAEVVVGNGSDELISLLTLAVARPDAAVVAPVPSFVMYELSAALAGVRFVGVALAPDFGLDLAATLEAIDRERPAVVYLAYPNNPTGNLFDDDAIEAVVRAAPGVVVLDEAYQPFAERSWMPRVAQFEQLIVMRTVSKLGLAGIRVGYLAAAPQWTRQIEKLRPPYNVSVLDEAAACFALEHLDVFDAQAARIRGDRERLAARLAAIDGVTVFPSHANFLLVRIAGAERVWRRLLERKVLVRDVGRMHRSLADCLRVTVGTPQENDALVDALVASIDAGD